MLWRLGWPVLVYVALHACLALVVIVGPSAGVTIFLPVVLGPLALVTFMFTWAIALVIDYEIEGFRRWWVFRELMLALALTLVGMIAAWLLLAWASTYL